MYAPDMVYTISDIRRKVREVFNSAENGEVVIIERYNKRFVLLLESQYLEGLKEVPDERQ